MIDETGFIKKGVRSAGVQRQYTGTTGKIDVLAGQQVDDRMPPAPRPVPATPAPVASLSPDAGAAVHLEWGASEDESPSPADTDTGDEATAGVTDPKVVAIAEHMEELDIPADLARTKVRELLAERDPGYKIGDKPLSKAITYRRAG